MLSVARFSLGLALTAGILSPGLRARAQESTPFGVWSAQRSWSLLAEYSPDSNHIFLGISQGRQFLAAGGAFSLRLGLWRAGEADWTPEVRPFMAESDPAETGEHYSVCVFTSENANDPCTPISGYRHVMPKMPVLTTQIRAENLTGSVNGEPYYEDYSYEYGRRWTYVGGFSPLNFTFAFLPRSRVQPMVQLAGGFAVSPRDIPMFDTSSFNFTFGAGGGLRMWHSPTRATLLEFRIQHLSNGYLGTNNDPGVDSRVVELSYVWGRR